MNISYTVRTDTVFTHVTQIWNIITQYYDDILKAVCVYYTAIQKFGASIIVFVIKNHGLHKNIKQHFKNINVYFLFLKILLSLNFEQYVCQQKMRSFISFFLQIFNVKKYL